MPPMPEDHLCDSCGHYGCPGGNISQGELTPTCPTPRHEPCGDYRCCIN